MSDRDLDALIEEFIAKIETLTQEERTRLFVAIEEKWCLICGSDEPCYCKRDEDDH